MSEFILFTDCKDPKALMLRPYRRFSVGAFALAARIFTTAPEISLRQCFALFTAEREWSNPSSIHQQYLLLPPALSPVPAHCWPLT
ncbi:MAG: hypothetical protein KME26_15245 [Oscillatoria princeps RMCB-10]|nr:hypothetical protein [Oscillatoria princeps RMCB-10]